MRTIYVAAAGVAAAFLGYLASRKLAGGVAPPGGGAGEPFGPPAPPGGGSGGGGLPVDPYAAKDITPKGVRDLTAKPGVLAFRSWALDKWGEKPGSPQNIVADKDGEHGEGRAWDLMTLSKEHGQGIVDALLASEGAEPHALARRAGIMYMIWNKQQWRAYPQGALGAGEWGPYSGASTHEDHIHFSFGWPGARGETSLYSMIGPPPVA